MKNKIIYSDEFLGYDVQVKVVKDFLPLPADLVLKKDFRNRSEVNLVQVDSLSSSADSRLVAVA